MKGALALLSLLPLAMGQATVYLIRHGEKASGNGLSSQGEERAQCLKTVFGPDSSYDIGYIIAEQPSSSGKHQRPYDTVEPLAEELGLTVDTSCTEDDSSCVADLVNDYSGSGNILICWEHHNLQGIAEALGDSNAPSYPDDSYNLIWTDPYDYTSITSITSENCPGIS